MGTKAFEKIMLGLKDVKAFGDGAREGYRVTVLEALSPLAEKSKHDLTPVRRKA